MAKAESWEVTDELWKRVEPLILIRQRSSDQHYFRNPGGGRKPKKDPRLVFEAIVYVLCTGCQWKALPAEKYGSASAIHARFLEWEKAGVFEALWQLGLAEYDEFEGIAWRWQSVDGATGTRERRFESDGSGEKRGASAIFWWPGVASRCHSS